MPTADNTHQVAQRARSDAQIVYVDKDPVVIAHARALLLGTPEGRTAYLDADVRDPDEILNQAAAVLDFDEPIAVMLVFIMHVVDDQDDPYGIVHRIMDAVPSGSYMVFAHAASDVLPVTDAANHMNQLMAEQVSPRSRDEVSRFFDGLELVDPGVVQPHQWLPGIHVTGANRDIPVHCGVARKP